MIFEPDGRIARVNDEDVRAHRVLRARARRLLDAAALLAAGVGGRVCAHAIDEVIRASASGEYDVVLCRKSGERFPAIVTVGVTSGGAIRAS